MGLSVPDDPRQYPILRLGLSLRSTTSSRLHSRISALGAIPLDDAASQLVSCDHTTEDKKNGFMK